VNDKAKSGLIISRVLNFDLMNLVNFSKKILVLTTAIPVFIQCDSGSCEGEPSKAKVESNSYSVSSIRVWVTFNHQDSGQSFQVVDVTEDNPKTTAPLPAGQYSIHATVTKSTGTQTLRLNARLKDCVDYTFFVNATSLSMNLNGEPR
jgi:hypothetical protein